MHQNQQTEATAQAYTEIHTRLISIFHNMSIYTAHVPSSFDFSDIILLHAFLMQVDTRVYTYTTECNNVQLPSVALLKYIPEG